MLDFEFKLNSLSFDTVLKIGFIGKSKMSVSKSNTQVCFFKSVFYILMRYYLMSYNAPYNYFLPKFFCFVT